MAVTNRSGAKENNQEGVQGASLLSEVGGLGLQCIPGSENHIAGQGNGATGEVKVYLKLFSILEAISAHGRIEKDKHNESQNYSYLSETAVKQLVQPLLVQHKLMFLPIRQRVTGINDVKESKQRVTNIEVDYRWVDIESGAHVDGTYIGSGADSMDKGLYKALTGGGKQIMCNTFQIPTGDDPEREGGNQRSGPARKSATQPAEQKPTKPGCISEGQQKRIFALMKNAGKEIDQVKAILARFGYESRSDIKVKDYDAICKEIDPSC